jgi:xylan 1,4-beta-xylosidase
MIGAAGSERMQAARQTISVPARMRSAPPVNPLKIKRIGAFFLISRIFILSLIFLPQIVLGQSQTEKIEVNLEAPSHDFPHYWEQMFGSGRAVLSLRDEYRRDLREVKEATGFEYIRFHAIFHDEVGLYNEDSDGKVSYNFSYIDQIYDGLLADHVRPFVELSFMPQKLAAEPILHSFWYKPNISPPKDYDKWDDMIAHFAHHLIERYGIDEVSQWYFEVWNEPNLDFWAGKPKDETYFKLYDSTARTLKLVDSRLRVGGPATAQAAWVDRFIKHTVENKVPVDFISTHVYGNDSSEDVFGTHEKIPRTEFVCRAVQMVHDQVQASPYRNMPLIWSEYNASYKNEPEVTDSEFMGPWLANTIRECDGIVTMMSYWTFSDVFEEQGVTKEPFYGGFGLIAEDGLPKPSFNAFKLLHGLGNSRIDNDSHSAIVTRRADGTIVMAVWNLYLPETSGENKQVVINVKGSKEFHRAVVSRVDSTHGSLLAAYAGMGKPAYPTVAQIQALRNAASLPPPEQIRLHQGELTIDLPPQGLALIEFH